MYTKMATIDPSQFGRPKSFLESQSSDKYTPSTPEEAELRGALRAGYEERALQILEKATFLRFHRGRLRTMSESIEYWRSVCSDTDPCG